MLGLFGLRFWPGLAHGALYAPFRDKAGFTARSRASEIVLTGNFPYWLETVLGFSRFIKTPTSRRFIPFICSGLLNYRKALEVLYTLSYVTCFQTLMLYLELYVLRRVAGTGGLASLSRTTVGLVSGNTEVSAHWIAIAAA
jgi:hypothetical protein